MKLLQLFLLSLFLLTSLALTPVQVQESAESGQESPAERSPEGENASESAGETEPGEGGFQESSAAEGAVGESGETAYLSEDEASGEGTGTAAASTVNQKDPMRSVYFMWAAYTAFFLILFVYVWNLGRRQKRLVEEVRHLRRGLATYDIDNQVNQT